MPNHTNSVKSHTAHSLLTKQVVVTVVLLLIRIRPYRVWIREALDQLPIAKTIAA